jgi:hypothetical protein
MSAPEPLPGAKRKETGMRDWRTFTIGLLVGLCITLLIAATATKDDHAENERIGKYHMAFNSDDRIYVINTATGHIRILSTTYRRMPSNRWPGFEGPEAEKALKEMADTRERLKQAEIRKPAVYYDLTKVWVLKATIEKDDGFHAVIMDKGRPDHILKKPYTMYEAKKGEILESSDRPRIYKVEILDVSKNKVRLYRHDMEDRSEEERTFELRVWPNSE